ncbi:MULTISPECIES: hypothetical protein [unclassified Pseudomonas]|uniref:hypothetical protein n=1 Tax=unclassified Pseudomonas TaxID=196821 RepID=UPI00380BFAB2
MKISTLLGLFTALLVASLLLLDRNTTVIRPDDTAVSKQDKTRASCIAQMKKRGHEAEPSMQFGFCYIDALTPGLSATIATGLERFRPPADLTPYLAPSLKDYRHSHPDASQALIEAQKQALASEFYVQWWERHAEGLTEHRNTLKRVCEAHADSCVMGNYN